VRIIRMELKDDEWVVDFDRGMHYHQEHLKEMRHIGRHRSPYLIRAVITGWFAERKHWRTVRALKELQGMEW
jgi:hypothetical protein